MKAMDITFRTDASLQIGTGHVMRCLTLAHALRERGAECRFICPPGASAAGAGLVEAGLACRLSHGPRKIDAWLTRLVARRRGRRRVAGLSLQPGG